MKIWLAHRHPFFIATVVFFIFQGYCYCQVSLDYMVEILGLEDKDLEKTVLKHMRLMDEETKDYVAHISTLRTFVEQDLEAVKRQLRALGYYGAQVRAELEDEGDVIKIVFNISLGKRYVIGKLLILVEGNEVTEDSLLRILEAEGLYPGAPAVAQRILDAQGGLSKRLESLGFPYPIIKETQYIVDHRTQEMEITLNIVPGRKAYMGAVRIKGGHKVQEEHIRRLIPWKEKEPYMPSLLDRFRDDLYATGLFSMVNISKAQDINDDGTIDIDVELIERKHRSVGGGLGYRTHDGIIANFLWENRNLLGKGERLRFNAEYSNLVKVQELELVKPFFLGRQQSLMLGLENRREEEVYKSRSQGARALIAIPNFRGWNLQTGLTGKRSLVGEPDLTYRYYLLAMPLSLGKDMVDKLLDPSRGLRYFLHIKPSLLMDQGQGFLKTRTGANFYFPLWETKGLLGAARVQVGNIWNLGLDTIPADERFYAGGDQSVRGYGYQSLGPRYNDRPKGGKGLVELNLELRKRFGQTLGLVAFLDSGAVYEKYPFQGDTALRYGTGLGFRYTTPLGPIRFDVAFPINRRPGIDRSFAIYFNIGHAF